MKTEEVAIISNVWTQMITMEKGDVHSGHTHTFDHTHLLTLGKVKITVDGEESVFEAPCQIFIARGKDHAMECLSDKSVGTCIHVIRNGRRVEDIVNPKMCPKYSTNISHTPKNMTPLLEPDYFRESNTQSNFDGETRNT